MKKVLNTILSPKRYVQALTGNYYITCNTLRETHSYLTLNDIDTDNIHWDYPLDEISEALDYENPELDEEVCLVLVEVSTEEDYTSYEYRWFEITAEEVEYCRNEGWLD